MRGFPRASARGSSSSPSEPARLSAARLPDGQDRQVPEPGLAQSYAYASVLSFGVHLYFPVSFEYATADVSIP